MSQWPVWQPVWLPNTDYTVTAVVIPETFAGNTWRCTQGGTSGNSDPFAGVNPGVTQTVTDGSVTWELGTGFRQALQAGMLSIMQTFAAANPTIIRAVRHTRPRSLTTVELPVFWVGGFNETIETSVGVRTRIMDGFSCFVADRMGEPMESDDRINFVVDALTDVFTANYHAASGFSLLTHTATIDTEFDEGGTIFVAVEFQFSVSKLAEGRI
jgi:hypothetical protein